MPRDVTAAAARAHALLAGHLGGLGLTHGVRASRAAYEATRIAAEELLAPAPALEQLARRWAALHEGEALDQGTALGLAHLATGQGPRSRGTGEPATLPVLLAPVALLTFESPRNLLAASYHVAALTHPAEESRWAAVAVNVALARFLQGYRDFVPDLIEALRNNDAPAALVTLTRRLPVLSPNEILGLNGTHSPAIRDAVAALWLAEREPVAHRGVAFVNDLGAADSSGASGAVAAFSALAGARDASVPAALALPAPDADIRALALRLIRLT